MRAYVLVTSQYPRDTNVPTEAPRFIDVDPVKVLEEARKILGCSEGSDDWNWVSRIVVYALEMGRLHSIWNASSLEHVNREGLHTVAYVAWWGDGAKTYEEFHGDFAEKCGVNLTSEASA